MKSAGFYYRWYTRRVFLAAAWRKAGMRAIRGEVRPIFQAPEDQGEYWKGNAELVENLLRRADDIAEGHLTVLYAGTANAEQKDFWRTHPLSGAPIPHGVFPYSIDDYAAGDLFLAAWLGTLPFLPLLAQAWRITRDPKYLAAIDRYLSGWIASNVPEASLGWEDGLVIAFRVAAVLYTLSILGDAPLSESCRRRMERLIVASGWVLQRSVETPSFNHLLMSALGLFYCGLASRRFGKRWREKAVSVLINEQQRQFFEDGVHAERSSGYMRLAVEIYLNCRILGERHGVVFPREFDASLERSCEALATLANGRGELPAFGDGSDLDLFTDPRSAAPELAMAAVLFQRADFKTPARQFPLAGYWLMGERGFQQYRALEDRSPTPASAALAHAGMYVMAAQSRALRLTCGKELTRTNGHSHADIFAFDLEIEGDRVLVDPGSYAYYPSREWRDYFRSTAAHNTAVVDGVDQAAPLPDDHFGWSQYPDVRIHTWSTSGTTDLFDGEHDGYHRLDGAVRHRRRVLFVKPDYWVVVDDFMGTGVHSCETRFQFGPGQVDLENSGRAVAVRPWGVLEILQLEPECESDLVVGQENPIRGWVSAGYGHREPAPSLRFQKKGELPLRLCAILVPLQSAERVEVLRTGDGWQVVSDRFSDRVQIPSGFSGEQHEIKCARLVPAL